MTMDTHALAVYGRRNTFAKDHKMWYRGWRTEPLSALGEHLYTAQRLLPAMERTMATHSIPQQTIQYPQTVRNVCVSECGSTTVKL